MLFGSQGGNIRSFGRIRLPPRKAAHIIRRFFIAKQNRKSTALLRLA
ncbi:hypothetical protein HMPREF9120_02318, partial [Neisseria sp. oral taxon 020 str. F0370]